MTTETVALQTSFFDLLPAIASIDLGVQGTARNLKPHDLRPLERGKCSETQEYAPAIAPS